MQAYLVEGRNRVRVYEPEFEPPVGFTPVAATLEDAYLVMMQGRPERFETAKAKVLAGGEARALDASSRSLIANSRKTRGGRCSGSGRRSCCCWPGGFPRES